VVLDRAAGLLDDDGITRLERHLARCPACRADADAVGLALSLAALQPPAEEERAAVGQGAREALLRHRAGRRQRRLVGGMALAVAASAAFALAVPWLLSRPGPVAPPAARVAVAPAADWELPDLDAAWAAAGAADPEAFPEPEPEMLFAELQEIDFDIE
jgi:predicted anti-sigma-YlaC factor YlaD